MSQQYWFLMQSSHYPGTEKKKLRHQILRNKRRKPGSNQERTIHQMSPLLQSPATTLTVVGSGNSKRTGSMTDLDQGLSPSRSNSPAVRKKRRAGSKTPSPDCHSRKIHRKRQSESDRHRSTSRSSSATPSERFKSKRQRRKYSGRSQTSSDESSRSRSWSPSLRRKEAVHSGSGSPVSPQRPRKRHSDSTGHSRKRVTSSSGYSKQRLKKHSHMK